MFRKYEEISPPHVQDFCYITEDTYTKSEVNIKYVLLLFELVDFVLFFVGLHSLFVCNNVGGADGS